MFKLCAIIPKLFRSRFQHLVSTEFPDLLVDYLLYDDFKQAAELIEDRQSLYDAVVFGGPASYNYTRSHIQQKTYWTFFPRSNETLLLALVKAQKKGWNLSHLSIDTFQREHIMDFLKEAAFDSSGTYLRVFTGNSSDPDYADTLLNFHLNNIKDPTISGCITSISTVATELKKREIDFISAIPPINIMRECLHSLRKYCRIGHTKQNSIAAIIIKINTPPESMLMLEHDYQFMLEKLSIAREITHFAFQLRASVIEESSNTFILYTFEEIVRFTTSHFTNIDLLKKIKQLSICTITMGFGLGESFSTAQKNAWEAVNKTTNISRNEAYVITTDGKSFGPVLLQDNIVAPPSNQKLQTVADKSGISINTVFRLHSFLLENHRNYYTSQEIADGLNISKRNSDRLIEKLQDARYATIEGKKVIKNSGRPSRLIKIQLF